MVSMFKKATLCLVALSACQAVRGAAPEGQDVTKDLLLLLRLARNGKISEDRLADLTAGANDDSYKTKIAGLSGDDSTACTVNDVTPDAADGFIIILEEASKEDQKYADLIDAALSKGLGSINAPGKWGEEPYKTNTDANNVGRLLWGKSTTVFCVKPNCTGGKTLVGCKFTPGPAAGEAPFTEKYLELLKKRVASNVKLSDMTEADLNTPAGGGAMAPSFLLGGLVAALAMVAA